jgi:hypothetical protein
MVDMQLSDTIRADIIATGLVLKETSQAISKHTLFY